MHWLTEVTPPGGAPIRAAGIAGGPCTARAHAAAAIAALACGFSDRDTPLTVRTAIGRRSLEFTAGPSALGDVQALITALSSTPRQQQTSYADDGAVARRVDLPHHLTATAPRRSTADHSDSRQPGPAKRDRQDW